MSWTSGDQPVMAAPEFKLGGIRGYLNIIGRITPIVLPYWDKLLLRLLITQANAFISVFGVIAIERAIDDGIRVGDSHAFFVWAGISAVLGLVALAHMWIYGTMVMYVIMRVELALKRLVFGRVMQMPLQFHQSRPVGATLFRVNRDTLLSGDLVGNALPEIAEKFFSIATTIGLVLALRSFILLLVLIHFVAYLVFSLVVVNVMYKFQHAFLMSAQRVTAALQEILSLFPISKAFGQQRFDLRRYFAALADQARAAVSFSASDALWQQGGILISSVWFVLAYHCVCGYLTIGGGLTLGEWISTAALLTAVNLPLYQLVWTVQRLRVSAVPVQRVFETLDLGCTIQPAKNAIRLRDVRGQIDFSGVSFRYRPEGPDVLKDVSFTVRPGQKVAIVGLSGAGKTTIFNLLLRLYEPTAGSIRVDGHDLRDLDLESYLSNVGVVLQENFIFSASIRDNILFGSINASEEELNDVVGRAGLWSTIRALPRGLDTVLLEGGNLSMGQKQRIGIARTLIRDPKILLLDEPTSLLDPRTEEDILAQLASIEEDKTRLMIAHHISFVGEKDEILVMHEGRLVQRGFQAELSTSDGPYKSLCTADRRRHFVVA